MNIRNCFKNKSNFDGYSIITSHSCKQNYMINNSLISPIWFNYCSRFYGDLAIVYLNAKQNIITRKGENNK